MKKIIQDEKRNSEFFCVVRYDCKHNKHSDCQKFKTFEEWEKAQNRCIEG